MKLWFRAKRYGWGWYPTTWQGWLCLVIYVALSASQIIAIESNTLNPKEILYGAIPRILVLTIILIAVCFITGEKPGWHWGSKK